MLQCDSEPWMLVSVGFSATISTRRAVIRVSLAVSVSGLQVVVGGVLRCVLFFVLVLAGIHVSIRSLEFRAEKVTEIWGGRLQGRACLRCSAVSVTMDSAAETCLGYRCRRPTVTSVMAVVLVTWVLGERVLAGMQGRQLAVSEWILKGGK